MIQRMIEDFKDSTGNAVRMTSMAAAAAIALFITTAFLCAAAFVAVLQKYGAIQACLSGAAIFFIVTLLVAGSYIVRKSRNQARAAQAAREAAQAARETAKSAMQGALADPMLMAAGLQLVRAIGIKKLIPIIAVAGLALGVVVSRSGATKSETSEA